MSGALNDGALTGFIHAATNPGAGAMDADPMGAIQAIKQRNGGVTPRNPLLYASFDTTTWEKVQEAGHE